MDVIQVVLRVFLIGLSEKPIPWRYLIPKGGVGTIPTSATEVSPLLDF